MKTIIAILSLVLSILSAAAVPTDFSQSGDFTGFEIDQSGNAKKITFSIHSEWSAGAQYDPFGHLFGPAGEFIFAGLIAVRRVDASLGNFNMNFVLLSESGGGGLTLNGHLDHSVLPGESFDIDSAVSGVVDGQEWFAVLSFHGQVAADGSGSGDGSAIFSRKPIPDTMSTGLLACLGIASLLGLRHRFSSIIPE